MWPTSTKDSSFLFVSLPSCFSWKLVLHPLTNADMLSVIKNSMSEVSLRKGLVILRSITNGLDYPIVYYDEISQTENILEKAGKSLTGNFVIEIHVLLFGILC